MAEITMSLAPGSSSQPPAVARPPERFRLHVHAEDGNESRAIIVVSFVANVLVATAKTVAALITRSSSMRTEAVHSWVDVGNECFVVAAARSARLPADEQHALGYGRASYVWSLFASIGTLLLGAVVGVWQGVHELGEPDHGSDYFVGYVVIAVSFVLEGVSFVQTIHQLRKGADELGRDLFEHALSTSNSTLRAVFTEDFIALVALVVAALGMALHQLTGVATYDGVGSILIGLLMVVAATMLISRNAGLLAGKPLGPNERARLIVALRNEPEIERVPFVYAEVIGPERLLVIASVGIVGDHTQAELATILREIERRLLKHKYIGLAVLTLATSDGE
jgi:cation diffusion facilitator family transporter